MKLEAYLYQWSQYPTTEHGFCEHTMSGFVCAKNKTWLCKEEVFKLLKVGQKRKSFVIVVSSEKLQGFIRLSLSACNKYVEIKNRSIWIAPMTGDFIRTRFRGECYFKII